MKTLLLIGLLGMIALAGPARAEYVSSTESSLSFAPQRDLENLCSSLTYNTDRERCRSVIRGRHFDAGALRTCRSINYDSEKIECLGIIADKTFDSGAQNVCSVLTYDTDKKACLGAIAGSSYDWRAVNVCKVMGYDSDKYQCLGEIANRSYSREEIAACSSLERDIDKRGCLVSPEAYPAPISSQGPSGQSPSCQDVIQDVVEACGLTGFDQDYLIRNANDCDTGRSESGKTEVAALLKRGSRDAVIVNTRGQDACRLQQVHFGRGGGAAYLVAVHGVRHSDKIFFRMNEGQLFYMDMGHDVYEVLNSNGRSYDVTRLDSLGNEAVELTFAAGNRSTLTFDQIDQRRREGKLSQVDVTSPTTWQELKDLLGW